MKGPIGIGTDIIEVGRIKEAVKRHGERFLERVLTQKERDYCAKYKEPWPQIAGRFSAKEAILKAFGTGVVENMGWHEIEIINNPEGKPEVFLSKKLRMKHPDIDVLLSISHCENYATATALLVGKS